MEQSRELYFKWLLRIVCTNRQMKRYERLLRYLFETEFYWSIDKDANRANDGLELRKDFYDDTDIFISQEQECTVLEMMVALAVRCEKDIMGNDVEDRTGEWFWRMIDHLGLSSMDDGAYSSVTVHDVIEDFLNREFKKDGDGSLFYIPGCNKDLRKVEIWRQMNMYLSDID